MTTKNWFIGIYENTLCLIETSLTISTVTKKPIRKL